ncbi:MAG TPA: class II aldolase/adducin family protein [Solirubrobacterales bacterium]|nr:class II aldolase/adducin family protein [Solirubrobacterales bacterium]
MSSVREDLEALCRTLGEPERELAILAEGNASAADGERLLVTASGSSLRQPRLLDVALAAVLDAIDAAADDAEWARLLAAAGGGEEGMRPTVEVGLHAVAVAAGAAFVGHTHPTAVNGVLCSERADALAAGAVFPDQIVVCGPRPLFLPYVDPGLALARVFRDRLREHREAHDRFPKVAYLRNHGLVALGETALEVVQITAMAVKAAQVVSAALAAGGPVYLDEADVTRIDGRLDEAHRRAAMKSGRIE